ncbi:MAG TPA: hypothetical protein VKE22_14585 [Haliangiales bacterium]|nr:hypothetical protein [Haliangiales bacterium]
MKNSLCVVLVSLAAASAHAQKTEGGLSNIQFDQTRIEKAAAAGDRWSLFAGETVGDGDNAVSAELGWPDLTLGFTHGTGATSDIGVKFELTYAFEGSTLDNKVGFGVRVPFRFNVMRGDKLSVLLHVDPGIKLLTYDPISFGVQAPLGVVLAFRAAQALSVGFAVDVPFVFYFTGIPKPLVFIPPQFGPVLEYHVDKNVTLGFNARFGPLFYFWSDTDTAFGTFPGGSNTKFAFRVQFLVGYRL